MQGTIIGYDEGNFGIYTYSDHDVDYDWVGIKFSVSDTSILSGIMTVLMPTITSPGINSYVTSYDIKIWKSEKWRWTEIA